MKFIAVCKESNIVVYETTTFSEILKFKHLNYTLYYVSEYMLCLGQKFDYVEHTNEMILGMVVFNPFTQKNLRLDKIYQDPSNLKRTLYDFVELNPKNPKFPDELVTSQPIEYPIVA